MCETEDRAELMKLTKSDLVDHIEDLERIVEHSKKERKKIEDHAEGLDYYVCMNNRLLCEASTAIEAASTSAVLRQMRIMRGNFRKTFNVDLPDRYNG